MIQRKIAAVLTLLALTLSTWAAFAQGPRGGAAGRPPGMGPAIATVAGRPIAVSEFELRAQRVMQDYARRSGSEIPADKRDVARRQVLEGLIRAKLYALEAQRLGMMATAAEGEAELKRLPTFSPGGRFDSASFERTKRAQPAAFMAALLAARGELAARRLSEVTERRLSPPVPTTETAARRALTKVSLDMLPLRTSDFAGTFTEPRESQVLAWYRAHPQDFERRGRASLTAVFVNSPRLADSLRQIPSARAAWDQSMRLEAERIISRTQAGDPLDSAAGELGLRGKILVETGRFPGYWRGTEVQSARIFLQESEGRVQPEPIRSSDGWLVIRADDVTPPRMASFTEASGEIRALLRKQASLQQDENDRRAVYAELRDSLVAPGWPIRFAAVDTAKISVPEPGAQDLDTYFRAHQADYATFDSRTGSIVTSTLAEVRDDVRRGCIRERRQVEARALGDRLLRSWKSGRRDAALEARLGAKLTPPAVSGSRIDTGFVAKVLSDTLWKMADLQQGGLLPYKRGFIVWQGLARVDKVTSTFEQAGAELGPRVERRRAEAELTGARALYDADPGRFRRGNTVHFTRVNFTLPDPIRVPLTHAEVEKWFNDHIDKYSQPEMVTVRHILISPANKTAVADAKALAKATEILRRIQGGESFADLARAYSEDPATRELGGALGSLRRGSMLDDFENVVFRLPSGTLYDRPVKTELGYHVVEVTEHLEPIVKPLRVVYGAVAMDAATDKSNQMALDQADSLLRAEKNPRTFAAAGARAGATVLDLAVGVEERFHNPETDEYFARLKEAPPGYILPKAYPVKGQGAWLGVVDSITAGGDSNWERARGDAIVLYRREAGARALESKRAELDSMLAAGLSPDSLGAYWGGLVRVTDQVLGRGVHFTDTSDELDSLLFGGPASGPPLPVGQLSGWARSTGGFSRVRIISRSVPSAEQVAQRTEQLRVSEVQEKLIPYFDELKARYRVVIHDRRLRDIEPFPEARSASAR